MTEGLTVFCPVSQGVVRRRCGYDGHWEREDNGQVWRDMTQCEEEKEVASQEVWLQSSFFFLLFSSVGKHSFFCLVLSVC